jgi:hypothetical protein
MLAGTDFSVFIVCNVANPSALEVIELPASRLMAEEPKVESIYYWYRRQLDRCHTGGGA